MQITMKSILRQLQIVKSNLETGDILFKHAYLICSSKINFEEVLTLLNEVCVA